MKSKNMKKAIIFLGLSLSLSSCTNTYVKAIDLETANRLVNSALTEQNSFEVQSTSYSLRSEISEYVLDEFNQKKVFKQSSLEVDYMAPYLRSDEITKYRLDYSNETRYLFDGSLDTLKQVRVTEYVDTNDTSNRHFVVTENNVSHNYAATTDSAIASFINLPTLINSNNVTSLTLCQAYMGSIGKFNNLTSFEALSSGGDSFQITFEGESEQRHLRHAKRSEHVHEAYLQASVPLRWCHDPFLHHRYSSGLHLCRCPHRLCHCHWRCYGRFK